jgi:hypothetical protein
LAYRAVQVTVIPLIGILYASYYAYALAAPFNSEVGAIMAGVVAAGLIGLVYLAPVAYLTNRVIRRNRFVLTKFTIGPSAVWFAASVAVCFVAYSTGAANSWAIATSSLVLSTLSLGGLVGARAFAYVQLPSLNPANMALLVRRFARTLP